MPCARQSRRPPAPAPLQARTSPATRLAAAATTAEKARLEQEQREAAYQRLPKDHTWLLMESGGKAVYVNHPLTPGQPSLAQSQVAANGF